MNRTGNMENSEMKGPPKSRSSQLMDEIERGKIKCAAGWKESNENRLAAAGFCAFDRILAW